MNIIRCICVSLIFSYLSLKQMRKKPVDSLESMFRMKSVFNWFVCHNDNNKLINSLIASYTQLNSNFIASATKWSARYFCSALCVTLRNRHIHVDYNTQTVSMLKQFFVQFRFNFIFSLILVEVATKGYFLLEKRKTQIFSSLGLNSLKQNCKRYNVESMVASL